MTDPLNLIFVVALAALVPFVAVVSTSFIKLSVVFLLVRNALGVQQIADYYDKLPQMPQLEALHNLVALFEAMSQTHVLSAEDAASEGLLSAGGGDDLSTQQGLPDGARDIRVGRSRAGSQGSGDTARDDQQRGFASEQGTGEIVAALQAFDPDVTHQYAALDILREHFSQGAAPEAFMRRLDQVAQLFEQAEVARDVRAGLAVARLAAENQATLATDPAAVRNSYRAMLREQKNFGELFDSLPRFDPSAKLEAVIEIFRTAAGQDLASTSPSTDPRFLGHLLSELGKLKKIQTAYEMIRNLIVTTERVLAARERGTTMAVDITSRMLHFAGRPTAGLADARTLIETMRAVHVAGQVIFANGLRGIHIALPDDMMPSHAARLQQSAMLTALQELLVAQEEQDHSSSD